MFTRTLQIKPLSRKAFTLIEMLVVIFVLWIGILSIAVLITKNMSIVKNIHVQNTATILAREGIEMTYNVRDTNTLLWYERDCAQRTSQDEINNLQEWQDICQDYMRTWDSQTHRFIIDGWLSHDHQITLSGINGDTWEALFNQSKLYLTGLTVGDTIITWYTHIWGSTTSTSLARYIEFTGMNDLPTWSPIHNTDIHHITSKVLYQLSDTTTGEVILESLITNQD
jgi:Tfp pilus assembly protein PilV